MARLTPAQRKAMQSALHGITHLPETAVWSDIGQEGQAYLRYVAGLCKRRLIEDDEPTGLEWHSLIGTAPTNIDPAATTQEDPFGE